AYERVIDLTRGAVVSPMELAAEDQPGAHPRPDREEDEVAHTLCDATPLLPERREVDVVLEGRRKAEPVAKLLGEGSLLEAGHVRREAEPPCPGFDHSRHADHGGVDQRAVEPGRVDERV